MTVRLPELAEHPILRVLLCLILGLTSGCGTSSQLPSGSVNGRVTFQGAPVTAGVVNLMSKTRGVGASGALGPNGDYVISEPVEVGEYKVIVTLPPPPPPRPEDGPPKPPQAVTNIPSKYRSEATSDLTATVEEGANALDFDLQP